MTVKQSEIAHQIIPRLIRVRDVPFYLGMDKNRFNKEVRPLMTEIKIGKQGIAFDRLELDAWVDEFKLNNSKPIRKNMEENLCLKKRQASSKGGIIGTSTKKSVDVAFAKALEQAASKKRKNM
jgi:predicted DNA-binding transcriptional regulator AlpA